MSKSSRFTLSLLAASAVGVGTIAAVAQTVLPEAPAAAVERAAPGATDADARVVPAQFFGGKRGRGGRGMRGAMMGAFQDADADGNGSLTQVEIDQFLAAQLADADADTNGSVNLDEFQTIYLERTRPNMVDAFQRLDEDGDGQITSAELSDRFGTIVQRMDRNGDDALSMEDRGRRGDRDGRRGRDRGDRS